MTGNIDDFFAELDAETNRETVLSRYRHERVMAERQKAKEAEERAWRSKPKTVQVTAKEHEKTVEYSLTYFPKPEPQFEQADISRVLFTPAITPHCYLHSLPGRKAYQTPEPERKIKRRRTEVGSVKGLWEKLQAYNRLLDAVYQTRHHASALCRWAEGVNEMTEQGTYALEGITESDRKVAKSKLPDLKEIVEMLGKDAVKTCEERAALVLQIRAVYGGKQDFLRMTRVWNS